MYFLLEKGGFSLLCLFTRRYANVYIYIYWVLPLPCISRKGFTFRFNRGLLLFWDCYRLGAVPKVYRLDIQRVSFSLSLSFYIYIYIIFIYIYIYKYVPRFWSCLCMVYSRSTTLIFAHWLQPPGHGLSWLFNRPWRWNLKSSQTNSAREKYAPSQRSREQTEKKIFAAKNNI